MKTLTRFVGLVLLVLALALNSQSVARNIPFVAAFSPLNSMAYPFSGEMQLNFNRGIISGTYSDTSIRPGGPLRNRRNVAITGGMDDQGNIHLSIGPMRVRGTLDGQWISGTATVDRRMFTFRARQGAPGQPAQ
ncbi:MAG TPA: hypothetical protein VF741_03390 [Candidatus Aquilonibacter sp.]